MDVQSVLIKPVRYMCAFCISLGGLMHLMGLIKFSVTGFDTPWWAWAVFGTATVLYPLSGLGILKNLKMSYYIPLVCPAIGGAMIFTGLVSPELTWEILIPGTLQNEITIIGFLTLNIEPVATAAAMLLIYQKVWELKSS